ncbi:MAG: polyhydroxyalkanoate synthesis repressor PhaR [Candidatus Contendobacter odensis]|uniref:Polyhydroxyalkanoate synthesis repressor PhaR n=1 Tax=Candidatus Contendibacter odensensis TaxID=1400860 RepID=A0A2G6PFM9_9GAMM|nr:MAG: polyhydroxyalkanoate synthesis repressor PhaR [Candidatus Contendobacter odensis]
MSETRIIKKYPNRRLYDTVVSSYITLEDVKRLVLERANFHVIDARTNTDITRGILLQIISEQEEQGNPIFTTEVLAHIIRFYGDTLQGMMGNYLEKSLQAFVDQQHFFREQMRTFMGKNPLTMITDLVEQNLVLWKNVSGHFHKQEEYIKPPATMSEAPPFSRDVSTKQTPQPASDTDDAASFSPAQENASEKGRKGKTNKPT